MKYVGRTCPSAALLLLLTLVSSAAPARRQLPPFVNYSANAVETNAFVNPDCTQWVAAVGCLPRVGLAQSPPAALVNRTQVTQPPSCLVSGSRDGCLLLAGGAPANSNTTAAQRQEVPLVSKVAELQLKLHTTSHGPTQAITNGGNNLFDSKCQAFFIDYDNDGDNDLFVTHSQGNSYLYRNDLDAQTKLYNFVEVNCVRIVPGRALVPYMKHLCAPTQQRSEALFTSCAHGSAHARVLSQVGDFSQVGSIIADGSLTRGAAWAVSQPPGAGRIFSQHTARWCWRHCWRNVTRVC